MVITTNTHSCYAIDEDELWSWGYNGYGQLVNVIHLTKVHLKN